MDNFVFVRNVCLVNGGFSLLFIGAKCVLRPGLLAPGFEWARWIQISSTNQPNGWLLVEPDFELYNQPKSAMIQPDEQGDKKQAEKILFRLKKQAEKDGL